MIVESGASSKVGEVIIEFLDDNPFSTELIEDIFKRFKNIYSIFIIDKSPEMN